MIPVTPAPEPASFDALVRQPGLKWLREKGLEGVIVVPSGVKVSPFWTRCLPDMMQAYASVCAYASLRIPPVVGGRSVDHFAPKSRALDAAYEWSNYRLACATLNSRKRDFRDVLDPFTLKPGTFILNPVDGSIKPASNLLEADAALAQKTIERLGLDDPELRTARTNLLTHYFMGRFTSAHLLEESPFIHAELVRQGLLRP